MKNLLILQPLPIAGVTTSRGSGAANLLTPDPREAWVDTATGTANLDLDFGQPRVIDTIFLGHVIPPVANATWTITGGVGDYTSVAIAAPGALRVPDVAGRAPLLSHALWTGNAVNVRYVRLALTQPAGSPPLSAGVVLAGRALVPTWNHEWGSGRRPIDTASTLSLPDGGFAVVDGVRKSAWSWTIGDLTDDELDALWEVALDRGESRPLLVVEDPDRTAGLRRRLHYGLFRQFREFERSTKNRTRWELRIEDWGADEAAPISSIGIDTTPDAFAFSSITDAARATAVQSGTITVTGIEAAAPIAITGGEYQVDGGAWTSAAGVVSNGAVLRVRLTSSAAYLTTSIATLTIGGVAADFSVRTLAEPVDAVPDAFAFVDQADVARNTIVESAPITVSGINVPVAISITGGEYRIGSGAWTSAAGMISNGDQIRVRVSSSTSYSTTTTATLTIGGLADSFSVSTGAAPSVPAAPTVTATAGNRQIEIAWLDGGDGGSPIKEHRVYVNGALVASLASASPYVLTGLTNDVTYSVQVSAVNDIGESPLSPAQPAKPALVLIAPTNADVLCIGDSRYERPIQTFRDARGLHRYFGAQGVQSWIGPLSMHKLRVGLWAHFGVSGTTSAQWLTNPRVKFDNTVGAGFPWRPSGSSENKGTDQMVAHPAGIIFGMDPTNDANLDINQSLAQIKEMARRAIAAGKVFFQPNGTPRDILNNGSLAAAPIPNNAQRLLLKGMIDKLDCQSGDDTAMPGFYAVDTYSKFQDAASTIPFRNRAGLLPDGVHDNIPAGYLRTLAFVERADPLPWYQALPSRIVLPTTDGLASQGRAQGAQAPFVNSNPILTPGNNGVIAVGTGGWGGTVPLASGVVEGWTLTGPGNSNNTLGVTATKGVKNANGDWTQKLVLTGSVNAGGTAQLKFEQQLNASFLNAERNAGRLSLTDTVRFMGWFYVAPGAQGLRNVGLVGQVGADVSTKTQVARVFDAPLTGEEWSSSPSTDISGKWFLAQTDDIRVSDLLLDATNGGPGLPTAFGFSSVQWQVNCFAPTAAAQTLAIEVQFGPTGMYLVIAA